MNDYFQDEKQNCISEVTRRNIADATSLNKINWSGRFDEDEFLARLFNLSKMRSNDHRYSIAAQDIHQHCVRNSDWSNDWVFYDTRFNLLYGSDDSFLKFLCEMIHPIVRPNTDEAGKIRLLLNEHLVKDGWEIREHMYISGRPIYAAFPAAELGTHTVIAAKDLSTAVDSDYVSRQVTRVNVALSTTKDFEIAIGTAKELVETICKTILTERKIAYGKDINMPTLVKLVCKNMSIVSTNVANQEKTRAVISKILASLGNCVTALAEFRNLHGAGHGKEATTKSIEKRFARLAVNASLAIAIFLFEAHSESKNQNVQD